MEDILTIATVEGVRIYAITTKNLVGHERRFNAGRYDEGRRAYFLKI